ncbi:MAG: phenylacetate--CoA ligase family protein [Chloroflexi bacterium]|nr:phenylacetate--CoA ligase family protein [Chloroflexota bacterium]
MTTSVGFLVRWWWSVFLAAQLRGQSAFPFKPLAVLERERDRRARAMVAYAYRYVPYYHDTLERLKLRPADFRGAADLAQLPVIEREQLQHTPDYFVSRQRPISHYLKLRTGGSTGAPRTVYWDTRGLFLARVVYERERALLAKLTDRPHGYRHVSIGSPLSSGLEIQHFMHAHSLTPGRLVIQRHHLSLFDSPEKNWALIQQLRPAVVQCYGSYLDLLCAYVQRQGEVRHRPRAIVYSSDGLSPATRRWIETDFGVPVFSSYQAIEALRLGFECDQHTGLHQYADVCPVRIVDAAGRDQPIGVSGDVIVSNLINHGTVLLNYRLGDIAAVQPGQCACGRTLPLLSLPQGRSDDWLQLSGGQLLHPQAIRIIFTGEMQVWQYQVVQQSLTHFKVAIVAAADIDQTALLARLTEKFTRTCGADLTLDFTFVDSVPRTAQGKVRPILSLMKSPHVQ